MRSHDKFGRPIHDSTWRTLVDTGARLVRAGYEEHAAKPNLFVRRFSVPGNEIEGEYYADMRGTNMVPIWHDPNPLFYAFFRPTLPPPWMQRRLWSQEVRRLVSGFGVRVRLSFYEEQEPGGLFLGDGDGICARCGIDFQDEGTYCAACSPVIAAEQRAARLIRCVACGREIDPHAELCIRHHTSYFPPRTVVVHVACHAAIHLHGKHAHLAPPEGDAAKFYGVS